MRLGGELLYCVICDGLTYHHRSHGEWVCNAYESH